MRENGAENATNAAKRRPILKGNSWLQLICVLAIVIFGNLLASRWFTRVDLTQDQVYTLSQEGKQLISRLDRPLIVRVYFTGGLEAPYNNHEQAVVDKLEEFRAWSRGRMELVVIDPTDDEERMAEAQRLGISPVPYTFRSESRNEMRMVYMGAAFLYGERQTVLPAITSVSTIEYDIARTIKALMDFGQERTMGFVVGHGEPDLMNGTGPVQQLRAALQARARAVLGETRAPGKKKSSRQKEWEKKSRRVLGEARAPQLREKRTPLETRPGRVRDTSWAVAGKPRGECVSAGRLARYGRR